ncbi:MAG: Crp/Fnr family transcriptional regulator, partial [Ignavibacteriaceae bacterium]
MKNIFADQMRIINDHESEKDNAQSIDIKNFLKQTPVFSDQDEQTMEIIVSSGMQKSYKKGNVILFENELGSAIYFVIKGELKVSVINEKGSEVILTFLKESDFFGEMSVLDETEHSANIIAMEDTLLFVIRSNVFQTLLRENSWLSIALIKEIIQRIRTADMKIKTLSLKNSEGKVASVIMELADRTGFTGSN